MQSRWLIFATLLLAIHEILEKREGVARAARFFGRWAPGIAPTLIAFTTFVGEPDFAFNPIGCRGIGEIGITGAAAAVANAVYHATGKRVRDLPITPDKLLDIA